MTLDVVVRVVEADEVMSDELNRKSLFEGILLLQKGTKVNELDWKWNNKQNESRNKKCFISAQFGVAIIRSNCISYASL